MSHSELVSWDLETTLEIVNDNSAFRGDGELFRLVSEAHRLRFAHLFDPHLAVSTSLIDLLPHQITAVYEEMLTRQPLRFLLADDPGAGKTIMAGLLIRELWMRGDLKRCLIVCPGSLVTQWQNELLQKFHLRFEILTNGCLKASGTGNPFTEIPLLIARLDHLSRNEQLQAKLKESDWDLVVIDEAHKLSASYSGDEIRKTKRYKLGEQLFPLTRHLLLMTATPHNGKEADFQLFLALLDKDRFEGQFRERNTATSHKEEDFQLSFAFLDKDCFEGEFCERNHSRDISDLMRRLIKEDLYRFDGKPLFPERRAHTVQYMLSEQENILYEQVTNYVREEFNRAEVLENKERKGTVAFALMILQRRLASSPEAIYQSLKRRRERLEERLEKKTSQAFSFRLIAPEEWDEDFEDLPSSEREEREEEVVDEATAAQSIAELKAEVEQLKRLQALAHTVKNSGQDRKWEELSKLLQENTQRQRQKLVIFTEHRDTLNYLRDRITKFLGNKEAVVTIYGSMTPRERKRAEADFKEKEEVQVLIATDAAGEGINLQRAHLMVNYDLPWNPNRLEQRFGRIHRIGQTEVCHLWNLVAEGTREGDVYLTLLRKLECEQKALGGKVFDVLGKAIAGKELRDLFIEAIRYGDSPEVKAKLKEKINVRLDRQRLQELLEERALAHDSIDLSQVQQIRHQRERSEAHKLQPHSIGAFFLKAFEYWGGTIYPQESQRYEIRHVPKEIRARSGQRVLKSYERICFDKTLIHVPGKPTAELVCPGHPLLNTVIDLTLEKHRNVLRQGAILVDTNDLGESPRVLISLEHRIQNGQGKLVSHRIYAVEIEFLHDPPLIRDGGYAPYLDYSPLSEAEKPLVTEAIRNWGLCSDVLEDQAKNYVQTHLAPQHFGEVKQRKEELINKTRQAVHERLVKEINYWDHRSNELRKEEEAGKPNAKLNSAKARQRAYELKERLKKRMEELNQDLTLCSLDSDVIGKALIVPMGLLQRLKGEPSLFAQDTKEVEQAAMAAVMAIERALGYDPVDVSAQKRGYDIESRGTNGLRFIEVKGRIEGADTVTITRNEILTALNTPENYILALVKVISKENCVVRYVKRPFSQAPEFGISSINYEWQDLWERGEPMSIGTNPNGGWVSS